MSIRKMLEKDLPAILKMTSKEGWISDRVEFNTFIDINPSGCFVYSEKNKVIGLITTFCHTTSAWIGNFIISKKYRGKGIGSKLLAKSIEYLNTKKMREYALRFLHINLLGASKRFNLRNGKQWQRRKRCQIRREA